LPAYTPISRTLYYESRSLHIRPAPAKHHPRASRRPDEALTEPCTLAAYRASGFTYTPKMEAVTKASAGRSSPAACLARAMVRERSYIAGG
jgi:hypothetical protein